MRSAQLHQSILRTYNLVERLQETPELCEVMTMGI